MYNTELTTALISGYMFSEYVCTMKLQKALEVQIQLSSTYPQKREHIFHLVSGFKQFLLIHSKQKDTHMVLRGWQTYSTHFNMKSKLGLCSRSPGYNCCVASMASPTRPANTSFCIPASTKKKPLVCFALVLLKWSYHTFLSLNSSP